jgi:hypothetical protein
LGAFRVDHSKPTENIALYNEVRSEKHQDKQSVKMLKERDVKLEGHLTLLNKALEEQWRPQDSSNKKNAAVTSTTARSSLTRRLSASTNMLPRPSTISSFVKGRLSQTATSKPKPLSGQSSRPDVHDDDETDDNEGRDLVEMHGLVSIQDTSTASGIDSKQMQQSDDLISQQQNDNNKSTANVPIATVLTASSSSSSSISSSSSSITSQKAIKMEEGGKVNLQRNKTSKPPSDRASMESANQPTTKQQLSKTSSITRTPSAGSVQKQLISKSTSGNFGTVI